MTNQRGFIAILTVILLIIGAVTSTGGFPALPDGTVVTPEYLYELIVAVIAPFALLFMVLRGLFEAITMRVLTQSLDAGDTLAALLTKEFLLGLIGAIIFVIQVFTDVTLLDEAQQALVADAILVVIAALLNSWGQRPSGYSVPQGANRR